MIETTFLGRRCDFCEEKVNLDLGSGLLCTHCYKKMKIKSYPQLDKK